MKHLLAIEELSAEEILCVIKETAAMKKSRGAHPARPLAGQCWALMFSKSSTRTRISFEVGIRELGGSVMFLSANDIQLGRGEPIKDTARVMGRMIGGAVIRTYDQSDLVEFARYSGISTINALTDAEHPCQILSDLFTIQEKRGSLENLKIAFIGDGDCNVARSWIWAASRLDLRLHIAAPSGFQPPRKLLEAAGGDIQVTTNIKEAADGADVLYTDVWVSMGKEEEASYRMAQLAGYQINESLAAAAASAVLVMHCLPAYRGKEISEETFEARAETIFDQAENRLHTQKAILQLLTDKT